VHLLASKRGRTSSSSDRGALIHLRALLRAPGSPASGERVVINKNEAHVADDVPDAFYRYPSPLRPATVVSRHLGNFQFSDYTGGL
jgi:hypothetical protein